MNITLTFEEKTVRMVGTAECPEFDAEDAFKLLGFTRLDNALRGIPANERGLWASSSGEEASSPRHTLKEPGLYRAIFRSSKPDAEAFKTFIFTEVLPCIRKHGCYPAPTVEQPKLNERIVLLLEQIVLRQDQMLAKQAEYDQRLASLEQRGVDSLIQPWQAKDMLRQILDEGKRRARYGLAKSGTSEATRIRNRVAAAVRFFGSGRSWDRLSTSKYADALVEIAAVRKETDSVIKIRVEERQPTLFDALRAEKH